MYDILIVDDDILSLEILGEQLKIYGDLFTPLYAHNSQQAIDILKEFEIALLVTDLMMPGEIDGWELVDFVQLNYPNVPCVVITGYSENEMLKPLRNKVRQIFTKPFKAEQLVEVITAILQEDLTGGNIKGISVGSFLQMLEMEGKTCLVEIFTSDSDMGLMYIHKGKVFDAIYGKLLDHEAACQLIALDAPHLKIKPLPKKKIRRQIETELMGLIMEAMALKDERQEKIAMSSTKEIKKNSVSQDTETIQNDQQSGNNIPENQKNTNRTALETTLSTLRSINGYQASMLLNFTGEVLAIDSINHKLDYATVGSVLNYIFNISHGALTKIDLGLCNEVSLKAANGLVIMSCSGVDSPAHFHIMVVLDKDGNQALTKIEINQIMPGFMDALSAQTGNK